MMAGMAMHAILPPSKFLVILAICVYSLGEHIQLGMKSTLMLNYSHPGSGGSALGIQSSVSQIGTLGGDLVVITVFSLTTAVSNYKFLFTAAAVLAGISLIYSLKITGSSETDSTKRRFYFHKKYKKYYMLEMFGNNRGNYVCEYDVVTKNYRRIECGHFTAPDGTVVPCQSWLNSDADLGNILTDKNASVNDCCIILWQGI